MNNDELAEFRRQKDEFFGESHHSPIPHHDRHGFSGLSYFDPNPELRLTLQMAAGDGAALNVQTSDGQQRQYLRAKQVTFDVKNEESTLTLLETPGHDGYFLPFRDRTSGSTTYGAGRYLDLEANDDETITIDFNFAYNPSCAYDEAYSCPLPPTENWLQVPIEAGEKNYKG